MEKKNVIILVICTMLIGIIIGLGSYKILDQNKEKENVTDNKEKVTDNKVDNKEDNEDKKEEIVPSKELSFQEINSLMDVIQSLDIVDLNNKDLKSNQEIPKEAILDFALREANPDKDTLYKDEYSYEEINQVIKKYFGYDLNPIDSVCPTDGEILFKYDKNKQKYIKDETHAHSIAMKTILNLYVSSSLENEVYTVKVKKAFSETLELEPVDYYYATYDDSNSFQNSVFRVPYDDYFRQLKDNETLLNENKDKLKEYTYTFKKQDGNFILQTYTRG